jgi:hypothetical protein
MMELLKTIVGAKEFWTTLGGAVVGGGIGYLIQLKNLREARANRRDDRKRADQGLGHALQFKMIKVHSNIHGVHRHIEECFEAVKSKESRTRNSAQDDRWNFCLTAGTLCPANQERPCQDDGAGTTHRPSRRGLR